MKTHILRNKCAQYRAPQIAKEKGIYPYYKAIESEQSTVVKIKGKDVLMFGSNSYLGLSNDPRLKEAAKAAIDKYGTSCSGSRFLNGTLDIHVELEKKLADLVGKDEAICFSTGFQVNLGVVSALCGRNDYLLLDRLNHASIIEGSRLAFGKSIKYAHNDMESLEKSLKQCDPEAIKLIVADGVFSMEGDIVPLPEMVALAEKYNADIMLDDAHSLGVLGPYHGHFLEIIWLVGRFHCSGFRHHQLPETQRSFADFQCQYAAFQRGCGQQGYRHYVGRTRAYPASLGCE